MKNGDVGAARHTTWGFTIGGAIFEALLPGGPDIAGQVKAVLSAADAAAAQRVTDPAAARPGEMPG